MGSLHPLRRLGLLLPLLAALAACGPRPAQTPGPETGPAPVPPVAPTPPPQVGPQTPSVLSDQERDSVLFAAWRSQHAVEVEAFEEFLGRAQVAEVVPTYQLLRSASMWKECQADPFEVPPEEEWSTVRDLLLLLRELQQRQIVSSLEVVSAYRNPRLNRCAGGAPRSSHVRFAVDIAPLPDEVGGRLCRFWREEGRAWNMGVSRYPTGRIHIDRSGYRTWGASHKRASSWCLQ